MHGDCDRARHWASADVDGELSTFERVLLANHVAGCPSCSEFQASVTALTRIIRTTPHESFHGIVIGRLRRRMRLRLAPAVAAMAVAAVGLGSILASSDIRTGSVAAVQRSTSPASVETMNLSTNTARTLASHRVVKPARVPNTEHRSLAGGPVLQEP